MVRTRGAADLRHWFAQSHCRSNVEGNRGMTMGQISLFQD